MQRITGVLACMMAAVCLVCSSACRPDQRHAATLQEPSFARVEGGGRLSARARAQFREDAAGVLRVVHPELLTAAAGHPVTVFVILASSGAPERSVLKGGALRAGVAPAVDEIFPGEKPEGFDRAGFGHMDPGEFGRSSVDIAWWLRAGPDEAAEAAPLARLPEWVPSKVRIASAVRRYFPGEAAAGADDRLLWFVVDSAGAVLASGKGPATSSSDDIAQRVKSDFPAFVIEDVIMSSELNAGNGRPITVAWTVVTPRDQ